MIGIFICVTLTTARVAMVGADTAKRAVQRRMGKDV